MPRHQARGLDHYHGLLAFTPITLGGSDSMMEDQINKIPTTRRQTPIDHRLGRLLNCTLEDIYEPVREAVSYRGLFTASWFGVREKHCSRQEIYDRLRASEHAI